MERVTRFNRKAEMGVGTLIIFISLLLVAAVAAGVLIQTAGSLQQKALSTGTQATSQISTNAVALEVSGTDGSDGELEQLFVIMKLAPGSDAINLDEVTLTLSTATTSQTLTYNSGLTTGNSTDFAVAYLQQGTNHLDGVLSRGDVVEINFNSTNNLTESESVRVNFIPKVGVSTSLLFDLPDVVTTQRVYLYP